MVHGPWAGSPRSFAWKTPEKRCAIPWKMRDGTDMHRNDVHDELQEAFEIGPLPAVGPDGAPSIPPLRDIPPPRPRLCEAGPCRNYHRFVIQLDAEDPRARTVPIDLPHTPGAQRVPGGTVYQPPRAFHTEVHHYCYPAVGVESVLESLPVIECNRWTPIVPGDEDEQALVTIRSRFEASPAGRAFVAQVAIWEAERVKETADDDEAERLIAGSYNQGETR